MSNVETGAIVLAGQSILQLKGLAYDEIGMIEQYQKEIEKHRLNLRSINAELSKKEEDEQKEAIKNGDKKKK